MSQIVQIAGSLLILSGFVLAQVGRLDPKSAGYLAVNAVGSGVLAVQAAVEAQWGFLLLEGVWAIVSVAALARLRYTGKDRAVEGS